MIHLWAVNCDTEQRLWVADDADVLRWTDDPDEIAKYTDRRQAQADADGLPGGRVVAAP